MHIINDTTTAIGLLIGFLSIIGYLMRISASFDKKFSLQAQDLKEEKIKIESNKEIMFRRFDEFKTHVRDETKYLKDEIEKKYVQRGFCKLLHNQNKESYDELKITFDDFKKDIFGKIDILNQNIMEVIKKGK